MTIIKGNRFGRAELRYAGKALFTFSKVFQKVTISHLPRKQLKQLEKILAIVFSQNVSSVGVKLC